MPMQSHEREIFAITGLAPEVQAVAFAKYSRSQESVKTTIDDLTDEKSAEFHEKWVLGYGDSSVADMAVIAIALENISMLGSKAVEDCRLASYQEKSTRYVPFDPTRWHFPQKFQDNPATAKIYSDAVHLLMNGYTQILEGMVEFYRQKFPRLETITEKAYENKLRARALDIARYLLPIGTLTNLGMVLSARELRNMISKLLAGPTEEIRAIGEEVRRAALEPSYNPNAEKFNNFLETLRGHGIDEETITGMSNTMKLTVKGAPTLIQFTEPKEYLRQKNNLLGLITSFLPRTETVEEERVDLIEGVSPENELVATLLYPHCNLPFRTLVNYAQNLSAPQKQALLHAVQQNRSPHDNCSREFEVSAGFIFDIIMDYGAFRDLQRHRLLTQIHQPPTTDHGFSVPRDLTEAGLLPLFEEILENNKDAFEQLAAFDAEEARYVLAMAWNKRTLFKMNLRELHHFIELRSKAGGHFSYRTLVYEMFEKMSAAHPLLTAEMRAVKMDFDADFYSR